MLEFLFLLCQSSRFPLFLTSFSLYRGIQQVLSSPVFLHQAFKGDQTLIIFSSSLYYFFSLHQSSHIILCYWIFLAISHPWLGEAASIEKNQLCLQWFCWWSKFHVVLENALGHKLWKDSALFWWLLCAILVRALVSSWYWWWGLFYGCCLILCPLKILDICAFSTSLSHLVFWILLSLIHFQSDFLSSAGPRTNIKISKTCLTYKYEAKAKISKRNANLRRTDVIDAYLAESAWGICRFQSFIDFWRQFKEDVFFVSVGIVYQVFGPT